MSHFLAHDMAPVDTMDMYGPRRRARTSAASMPISSSDRDATMPWRPQRAAVRPEPLALVDRPPEASLVQDANGRMRTRDDVFTDASYDGAARSEPIMAKRFPVTRESTAASFTQPPASVALFYGVKDSKSAPTSYGFQKLDLFDDVSPSRRAYLQRARNELVMHEEQQRRERELIQRKETDERRAAGGYLLEKEHTASRGDLTNGGRIRHDVSDADRKHRLLFSDTPPPRHKHFIEPLHEVTMQDREYLTELSAQADTWRRRQEEDRAASAAPGKSVVDILHDHKVPPRPRVTRDFTSAQSPVDAMQFHPDYQYLRDQTAEYSEALRGQIVARESGQDYPISRHSAPLHPPEPELAAKPNDAGRVRGLYDSLTREQSGIADRLGNLRGSNRVQHTSTPEQQEKRTVQQERRAMLDGLRQERQELERRLRDEDANLSEMEKHQSPIYTKLGKPGPKDGRIAFMHPENNVDQEVIQRRDQERREFVEQLKVDAVSQDLAKRLQRSREAQETRRQLESDPWRWNHDIVDRDGHYARVSVTEPTTDPQQSREYHAELDRLTSDHEKRALADERERIQRERLHLSNSLDEKLRERHARDRSRETKLRSFVSEQRSANAMVHDPVDPHFYSMTKEIATESAAGDPGRTRRDHVVNMLPHQ